MICFMPDAYSSSVLTNSAIDWKKKLNIVNVFSNNKKGKNDSVLMHIT